MERKHKVNLWDSIALKNEELLPCKKQIDIPFHIFDYVNTVKLKHLQKDKGKLKK